MADYQDLSEFERGVIVGAREMGHSISEVAMKFGFSLMTISRVYCEYRESGKTSSLRYLCNLKKYMKERDQRRVTRIIKRDRRAILPLIASNFNTGQSTSVTKNVAWSDDPRFQLNRADERARVWKQPHETMDPTCQKGTVQADGGSVVVWGVCSWCYMGPLIRLDTTLTGDRYVSNLSDQLHPFMSIMHYDALEKFHQDNAPPHTFRIAIERLQKHSSGLRNFRCSLKSPDMNNIEHMRCLATCCSEDISIPSYSY
ncbi:transposable element Tcb2 transposase [Trichonephila clavipes]|nr:transposable element Tcb2 transposase [Trichonephila clavipes]